MSSGNETGKLEVDRPVKLPIETSDKTRLYLGLEEQQRYLRVEWVGHNYHILSACPLTHLSSHTENGNRLVKPFEKGVNLHKLVRKA